MTDQQRERPAGKLEESSAGGPPRVRSEGDELGRGYRPEGGRDGLLRLRLDVSYDGTNFHGWARQPGLRSVQAELEAALRAVLRVPDEIPVRVAVAGRTDAGVHAIGQVCHCDVPASLSPVSGPGPDGVERVTRRLNGLLPADLRVRRVGVAPPGFDARWSAAWREYVYLVADHPQDVDPRSRRHVLTSKPLDVDAMQAATLPFLGEHDFAAFCRARQGASTVRTILGLGWSRRVPLGSGPGVTQLRIRSDAFCHSMVRALVGAFLAVGEGRWRVERPAELLAAAVRVSAVPTAPAHGLTLVDVGYPSDADLAGQAQRARRWRGR